MNIENWIVNKCGVSFVHRFETVRYYHILQNNRRSRYICYSLFNKQCREHFYAPCFLYLTLNIIFSRPFSILGLLTTTTFIRIPHSFSRKIPAAISNAAMMKSMFCRRKQTRKIIPSNIAAAASTVPIFLPAGGLPHLILFTSLLVKYIHFRRIWLLFWKKGLFIEKKCDIIK